MASGCNPDLNYDQFTANGTQTNFVITFNYHDSEDIRARINNVEMDNTLYSVNPGNPSEVIFNPAPAAGTLFIYRCTDLTSLSAVFNAGATIRAVDLNDNFEQLLLAIEDANNLRVQDVDNQTVNLGYQPDLFDPANSPGIITNNKGSNAALPIVTQIRAGIQSGADKTKLDGIETGATADQTAAEIRTLVGSATDSNVFTDADHTKLDGIETAATADQTDAEIKTAYENNADTNAFTDADHTKLDGIEAGATTDQTGAEIKTLYESQADTNAFTDADHTKLDGISSGATVSQWSDVTGGINYAGGKVGIGTSSPSSLLHLAANAPYITFEDVDNNQDWQLQATAWFALRNQTTSSELLRVNSGGNVGIGTSSPGSVLDIQGTQQDILSLTTTGSACKLNLADSATTGALYLQTIGNNFRAVVNGSERVRITGAGNLGIGTSAPTGRLTQEGGYFHNNRPSTFWSTADYVSIVGYGSLASQGSFAVDLTCNGYRNSSGTWTTLSGVTGQSGASLIRLNPTGAIEFKTDANKASGTGVNPNTRMRLDGNGDLAFSGSLNNNPVANNIIGIALRTSGNIITNIGSVNAPHQIRRNNDGDVIRFYRNSATDCGAIRVSSGTTHFDTSSDYRLKENIVAITDGIDRVKQLQPKRFNFIEFPENTVDGFIAHEAQIAVPEAISGEKDGMEEQEYEVTPAVVDEDGNETAPAVMGVRNAPKYQAIDKSKLVPLLTAALQEAIAKIETLEQRLSDAGIA